MRNGRFVRTRGYCTDVFFRRAVEWMAARRTAGRPFFASVTPNVPHDPFISPGAEWEHPCLEHGLGANAVAHDAVIANLDFNVGRLLDRRERDHIAIHTW